MGRKRRRSVMLGRSRRERVAGGCELAALAAGATKASAAARAAAWSTTGGTTATVTGGRGGGDGGAGGSASTTSPSRRRRCQKVISGTCSPCGDNSRLFGPRTIKGRAGSSCRCPGLTNIVTSECKSLPRRSAGTLAA